MQPFYVHDGDRLVATPSTRGPWSDTHQHAGPPSALLVRAAERATPGFEVARVTVEMQRPIPLGVVDARVDVARAGRKVVLMEGALAVDGQTCLVARVELVRVADVGAPVSARPLGVPTPEACPPFAFPFFTCDVGYHTAVETRLAAGAWGEGRAAMWMRMRVPLVEGETPSGAQRAVVAADAGSGVTAALDTRRFTFLNADLSVHLLRAPVGPWILLDGATTIGPGGRGLADTRIADLGGDVGLAAQTLVVEPR